MEATAEQIQQWKAKHGRVFHIGIDDMRDPEAPKLDAYAKVPDKATLGAASKFVNEDPVKAGDIMRSNCLLYADEDLQKHDEYIVALNIEIGKLFKIPAATVKEL